MKKNIIRITSVIIIALLFTLSSWSWRWVIFHGWSAVSLADHLLAGGNPTIEDRFIDYTIYTASGCVVFSTNNEDKVMIYCPHGVPDDAGKIGSLEHIIGPWYRQIT